MKEFGNRDLPVAAGDLDEIAPFLVAPDAVDMHDAVDEGIGFDISAAAEAPTETPAEVPAAADWDPAARNQQLRAVSIDLSKLESIRRDYREPHKSGLSGSKVARQEGKASRRLAKACARCALQDSCEIAGNLPGWHDLHRVEAGRRLAPYGQESRARFLKRLKKDPQASCLPPKHRS